MLTLDNIKDLISKCKYEDWELLVKLDDTRPYLQVYAPNGKDSVTGGPLPWTGRKWMLSYNMVPNEIISTAYKAVMAAMEHEVRECFRYRGVSIFSPHIDPDVLVDVVNKKENIQERPNNQFAAE